MTKYGYLLIEPGKPAVHSELVWRDAEAARNAGSASVLPNQRVVIVENRRDEVSDYLDRKVYAKPKQTR